MVTRGTPTSSPSFRFSEFIDRLLVRLYELDREEGSRFFDLLKIAETMNENVPVEWVVDAANVLRIRDLADILNNSMVLGAQITGEGRLYVEESRGITRQIKEDRGHYFKDISIAVNGKNNIVGASGVTQTIQMDADRGLIARVLDEMREALRKDSTLRPEDRDEASDYIDLVAREVKKNEPNQNILAATLETLSHIGSIVTSVNTVIKLINL